MKDMNMCANADIFFRTCFIMAQAFVQGQHSPMLLEQHAIAVGGFPYLPSPSIALGSGGEVLQNYHTCDLASEQELCDANQLGAAQANITAIYGCGVHFADEPAYRMIGLVRGPPANLELICKPPAYPHILVRNAADVQPSLTYAPLAPLGRGKKLVISLFSRHLCGGNVQHRLERNAYDAVLQQLQCDRALCRYHH